MEKEHLQKYLPKRIYYFLDLIKAFFNLFNDQFSPAHNNLIASMQILCVLQFLSNTKKIEFKKYLFHLSFYKFYFYIFATGNFPQMHRIRIPLATFQFSEI